MATAYRGERSRCYGMWMLLVCLIAVVSAKTRRRSKSDLLITPDLARSLLKAPLDSTPIKIHQEDAPSLGQTDANVTCIQTYCEYAAVGCLRDRQCRTALQCIGDCDAIEDDTPDKIVLQNCTAMCVVTYEDDALDEVNRCFDVHECISLEPINTPCRDTSQAAPPSQVSLMEGKWWATYGFNPVYDCYLCQRLTFSYLNETAWLYDSKYVTITMDGKQRPFELQAALPWPSDGIAQSITFPYEYQGMTHSETWKVLVVRSDLVLIYYCGQSSEWHYEGGLVLSRERTSTSGDLEEAREAFEKIGIDFSDFCLLDNDACDDGAAVAEEQIVPSMV